MLWNKSSALKSIERIGIRYASTEYTSDVTSGAHRTNLTREPVRFCHIEGLELLNKPSFNKGSAFTSAERRAFKLETLLPTVVNTLEEQVSRAYGQFKMMPNNLMKNSFCQSMRDQNQVLFYALITKHLKEMMSIIYTPTQGDAIAQYSKLFRRPSGCYLNINRPDLIEAGLAHWGRKETIDYIVVTDAEGILGIGDQGAGGIGISTAKLALMTACGGVHPDRTIPVVLDCGTDNEGLLNDPLYMGNRHERVRGEEYDNFVNRFVKAVKTRFPDAVLHFEDFGARNAFRLLERYQSQIACFNDDIQGTGAVTMATIKGALHATKASLKDTHILIYGAGSAGMGIAHQIVDNLEKAEKMTPEDARKKIYLMDRFGLITSALDEKHVTDSQRPFVRSAEPFKDIDTTKLAEVVKAIKPQVLIGASTQPGSFTEEVVKEMAQHVKRPVILPLSNPTRLHEAVPADLIKWTDGRVLVATGSPFPPVDGRVIAENNNMHIFPGIGLGAVLSRATRISRAQIAAAVDELAALSPVQRDIEAPLLPDIKNIREISARIATAVVLQAKKEGVASIETHESYASDELVKIPDTFDGCLEWVKSQMWMPEYRRLVRAPYN